MRCLPLGSISMQLDFLALPLALLLCTAAAMLDMQLPVVNTPASASYYERSESCRCWPVQNFCQAGSSQCLYWQDAAGALMLLRCCCMVDDTCCPFVTRDQSFLGIVTGSLPSHQPDGDSITIESPVDGKGRASKVVKLLRTQDAMIANKNNVCRCFVSQWFRQRHAQQRLPAWWLP